MSGIAGRLHLDGSPADASLLAAMDRAIAHRGPDRAATWTDGPVGFAHRAFWTTPEAEAERQPLRDPGAGLALVFDGRLDDREALAAELRGRGEPPRDGTDAGLVLRAYAAWGEACADRLVGDFALAIWDAPRRRLFAARDPMGLRPFVYAATPRAFVFASGIPALLADPAVDARPDEAYAREMLAGRIESTDATLYRAVRRLPGGHWMTIDADGARIHVERYWRVDFTRRLRPRDDRECVQRFLELMRQSVAARLRARGPVGAELSGGQDSTTVVALATDLLREGGARVERLRTYSIVYPGLACDESPGIDAMVARDRLDAVKLARDPVTRADWERLVDAARDFPGYPNGTGELFAMSRAQRSDGVRVVLTGTGGNECWEGGLEHLADWMLEGRWLAALREARASRRPYAQSAARLLYAYALRPLLRRPHPSGASRSQARTWEILSSGEEAHTLEWLERIGRHLGVEYRHPMLDRRVIEFSCSLPGEWRWRDGRPKSLLVEAMRNRLPREIVDRSEQADFTAVSVEALESARASCPMRDWQAGKLGWIDARQLERQYESALAGFRASGTLSAQFRRAWVAYGVSLWAARQGR